MGGSGSLTWAGVQVTITLSETLDAERRTLLATDSPRLHPLTGRGRTVAVARTGSDPQGLVGEKLRTAPTT